jgi:hypothetical protein
MVKNDKPVPQDVVKAAPNVCGVMVMYNQGYCAIQSEIKSEIVNGIDSS